MLRHASDSSQVLLNSDVVAVVSSRVLSTQTLLPARGYHLEMEFSSANHAVNMTEDKFRDESSARDESDDQGN